MDDDRPNFEDIALGVAAALLVETAVLVILVTWLATHVDNGIQTPAHGTALLAVNLRTLAWHTGFLAAGVPFWLLLRGLRRTRWWAAALAGFAGSYASILALAVSWGGVIYPLDFARVATFASLGALCWTVGRSVAYRAV